MSNLPAWKRALLEKKKQQEQQVELKKQQEQEAYIKSLPAWKRAIVMRDLEKNKLSQSSSATAASGNAPTNPQPAAVQNKWKAALSQSNKLSTSTSEKTESPAREGTGAMRTLVVNQKKESLGKPSWVREKSPSPPTNSSPVVNSASQSVAGDTSSPRTITRQQRRGSVQSLADRFKTGSPPPVTSSQQESKPIEAASSQTSQKKKEVSTPQQQIKKETSPQPVSTPTPAAASAAIQIDDSDLAGLPSWKRALIIKKRQKQAGLVPGVNAQPQSESANTSAAAGKDEINSVPKASEPLSPKSLKSTTAKTTKSRPDVVNRANENESSGSNKLVQKEGVTLHPPIFNEVDQWANVTTDDPKFTQLPQWKQALILRRRKDIAKRSGQETSPPESPTIKTASEKRKSSSSSSSGQAETKKGSKKVTSKSTAGKTEGKKTSTSKAKTKTTEEKKGSTKTSTKSKAKSGEDQHAKTVKTNATSSKAKSGSTSSKHDGSGGGIKPVRSAPTKPPEKKDEEKKEEEEPMFTWNFSKNSMDTGDAMSNSSDSELEDVQITSIDDELSDEDDSGIGGSGVTVLKSYKPLADSMIEVEEKSATLERSLSTSTSDPVINKIPRSESKSILIDPAKKSYKVLRRVSFSDSNLEIEHFYPKYDYSDYEDIEQELPDIFGRSKLRNSGLSHRLHPSLRTDNDTDSDTYRYGGGFNSSTGGSNSSSPSPPMATTESPTTNGIIGGGGLSSYTPSMLSPFDNLSSFTASPITSPIKEEETNGSTEVEQVDGNSADDYYSSLNADTAALLW